MAIANNKADSVNAMENAGLEIAMKAPSPEVPSVAKAIEVYLESNRQA